MSFAAAENDRRIGNALQLGVVQSVDAAAARAVVQFGDLVSPPLPVGQLRAGALAFWWMPKPGEQVLVGCPSGEIAQGVIICSVFAGNAPSADAATPMIALSGGRMVVDGTIEVTGDVIAGGVSLKSHIHTGVVSGGADTGGPKT